MVVHAFIPALRSPKFEARDKNKIKRRFSFNIGLIIHVSVTSRQSVSHRQVEAEMGISGCPDIVLVVL